jgi:hypothetical protein
MAPDRGLEVRQLPRRYPPGVEWAEARHWRCNNNAHPSRHGTYDGISMHPFETARRCCCRCSPHQSAVLHVCQDPVPAAQRGEWNATLLHAVC